MRNAAFIFVIAVVMVGWPSSSHAQAFFGGLDVFEFPCTCSPFMYTVFTPFFIGPVPITATLAVPDTPTMFPFFILHPGAWALGFYTPAVQACWMYAAAGCFILPTLGAMTPLTGTSP